MTEIGTMNCSPAFNVHIRVPFVGGTGSFSQTPFEGYCFLFEYQESSILSRIHLPPMYILCFSNITGKMRTLIAVQKCSVFPAYSKVMPVTPNYKNGEVETGVNEYE